MSGCRAGHECRFFAFYAYTAHRQPIGRRKLCQDGISVDARSPGASSCFGSVAISSADLETGRRPLYRRALARSETIHERPLRDLLSWSRILWRYSRLSIRKMDVESEETVWLAATRRREIQHDFWDLNGCVGFRGVRRVVACDRSLGKAYARGACSRFRDRRRAIGPSDREAGRLPASDHDRTDCCEVRPASNHRRHPSGIEVGRLHARNCVRVQSETKVAEEAEGFRQLQPSRNETDRIAGPLCFRRSSDRKIVTFFL